RTRHGCTGVWWSGGGPEGHVAVEPRGRGPAAVPVGDAHALAAARAPVEAVLARSGAERAVGGVAAGARPGDGREAAEADHVQDELGRLGHLERHEPRAPAAAVEPARP